MTREEEIRQKAEEYALNKTLISTDSFHGTVESFLAGAHNCDKEVNHWKESYEELVEIANDLQTENQALMIENVKLCNSWINVEDRLPEKSQKYKGWLSDTVFIVTNQGDGTSARYDLATKMWCPAKILRGHITHWMSIPELSTTNN